MPRTPDAALPLRFGAPHPAGPAAVIARRAADRLRAGSLWVYRSEIEQMRAAPGSQELEPGCLVTVLDSRGIPLGSALFSSASQITLRMVSSTAALSREAYLSEVTSRVTQAVARRRELAPMTDSDDACRLIFSEADQLPGIVADRYHDLILLQMLTQGTAKSDVREAVTLALRQSLEGISAIVERPDPRIRAVEQLPPPPAEPLYSSGEDARLTTTFSLNGLKFAYDAASGQKTGAFLDQRLNYRAAAQAAAQSPVSRASALDICTYQGGFALHLAQVCGQVTGVDASRAALEVADANLGLNPQLEADVTWIEADAFELLREYESSGQRYGTIVLDPPAFAKTRRAIEGALRGYKELNLRALKMLAPGGLLVTCSCSHHVALPEFSAILASAAVDSRRRVQMLESRGAAPDHPAILTLPETSYLKCLICRVE